jgi:hypothetical protein
LVTPPSENPLVASGKPLFFKVENTDELGLRAPAPRLGEAVRLCVRSMGAMQKEALVLSARTGVMWRLASDEGAYLAGLDEAPCPLSFLSVGMVSAYMNEIQALAAQRGMAIDRIRLVQDNFYTMRGSALKGTMSGGAKDVHLIAQVASDASLEALNALVIDATAASPLNGLMRGSKESLFALTHNGVETALGRAKPLGQPAAKYEIDDFDAARPTSSDWSRLVRRAGQTPRADHSVTLANGSLADEQDRLLHVRVICTLRADGVKHIEQHLYNPPGSIFHFLSDEAPGNSGQGMAPDATSYIAAGIGFCFMTQLGRYASIVKKHIKACGIVQDAHFSLGGASGMTGMAGSADPIETHVFLETDEDDQFARTALDMSEQTCFLHAFCKADLKAKVAIQPYSASGLVQTPPLSSVPV